MTAPTESGHGDELRAPLPRSFERLADDLVIGRHGDPHVAFAVLVYPDREPAVVAVTGSQSGAHDIGTIVAREDGDDEADRRPGKGRFFTYADLDEASNAMRDAVTGMRMAGYRKGGEQTLGEFIVSEIKRMWHWRRDQALEREMSSAAHAAKYAFKCEFCHSGFTERGLKMHQSRSLPCSRRLAEKQAQEAESHG